MVQIKAFTYLTGNRGSSCAVSVEIDSFEGCTTKTIAQKVNVNGAKIIGLDGDTSLDRTAKIIKSGDRGIRFFSHFKEHNGSYFSYCSPFKPYLNVAGDASGQEIVAKNLVDIALDGGKIIKWHNGFNPYAFAKIVELTAKVELKSVLGEGHDHIIDRALRDLFDGFELANRFKRFEESGGPAQKYNLYAPITRRNQTLSYLLSEEGFSDKEIIDMLEKSVKNYIAVSGKDAELLSKLNSASLRNDDLDSAKKGIDFSKFNDPKILNYSDYKLANAFAKIFKNKKDADLELEF
jgi:hypothetical protein